MPKKKTTSVRNRRRQREIQSADRYDPDPRLLESLLQELAPSASQAQIWLACDFAARWIDQYRERVSGTNTAVQAWHEARAQGKRELQALAKTIAKLETQIVNLSTESKEALPNDWTSVIRRYIDEEKREFIKDVQFVAIQTGMSDLAEVLKGAKYAVNSGATRLGTPRPSKHGNPDNFLACGMAETLGGVLHLKVSMAEEGDPQKRKPTSANYWRLMRLAFELAGAEAPEDLRPIMRAGRTLAGSRAGFDLKVWKLG